MTSADETRPDYSRSHIEAGKGAAYDRDFCDSSFLKYLWAREQTLLGNLISQSADRATGSSFRYLDFACGTGRLIASFEHLFDEAVGLDISEEMLQHARNKCSSAELICGDFRADRAFVKGKFDFATAFRFFPNAEGPLRRAAASFLSDKVVPGGRLVVNNHQNQNSLLCLFGSLFRKDWPWEPLQTSELIALLETVGFEVEGTSGFGILPGTARSSYLPVWLHSVVDRLFAEVGAEQVAQDVIIWLRRR